MADAKRFAKKSEFELQLNPISSQRSSCEVKFVQDTETGISTKDSMDYNEIRASKSKQKTTLLNLRMSQRINMQAPS